MKIGQNSLDFTQNRMNLIEFWHSTSIKIQFQHRFSNQMDFVILIWLSDFKLDGPIWIVSRDGLSLHAMPCHCLSFFSSQISISACHGPDTETSKSGLPSVWWNRTGRGPTLELKFQEQQEKNQSSAGRPRRLKVLLIQCW